MLPVERLTHERDDRWAAPAEQDRVDRHRAGLPSRARSTGIAPRQVNLALECAAGVSESVQSFPSQSIRCAGGSLVIPSHHTSPSLVLAVLVKIVFSRTVAIALGLVSEPVPGATPKNPTSGLIAWSRPSGANFIQAMSSPIVWTFQPGSVGISIAQVGLAARRRECAAMYLTVPSVGEPRISMCSASHP